MLDTVALFHLQPRRKRIISINNEKVSKYYWINEYMAQIFKKISLSLIFIIYRALRTYLSTYNGESEQLQAETNRVIRMISTKPL